MARMQSAGTLLYGFSGNTLLVLLVHPSGPYNRNAPWSIPKGLVDADEDLETAARRETAEETGIEPGALASLGWIDYRKSAKRVHAFGGLAPDTSPRCGSWEVDQVDFVPLDRARALIHPDQAIFLDRLLAAIVHGWE